MACLPRWDVIERALPPVCTLRAVKELPPNTVFIAIDTSYARPGFSSRREGDVGLALLPRLRELPWIPYGKKSPRTFTEDHDVQFYSIKGIRPEFIDNRFYSIKESLSKYDEEGLRLTVQGKVSEGPWGCLDCHSLAVAFKTTMKKIRDRYAPGCKIALVNGNCQDFRRMGMTSQDVISCFDYNISTYEIAQDESRSRAGYEAPGEIFSYYSQLEGTQGKHDNAERAIPALARLQGSVYPRRLEWAKIEVSTGINDKFMRPFRASVTVKFSALPPSINSAQKLAEAFESYKPIHVAAGSAVVGLDKRRLSIFAVGMTRGCLCFETNEALEKFIKETHNKEVDGSMLVVERVNPGVQFRL